MMQKLMRRFWKEGLLILVVAGFFLWRLGAATLQNWDEAIYAQVAREMAQSGDWLNLRHQGFLWFHKPPLQMWITAALYQVGGISEVTARLVSASAGVGTALLVFQLGRRIYGFTAALGALAVLLTSIQFMSSARMGMLDSLLVFCTYLAVLCVYMVRQGNPKYWYGVWIACGLAVMTKSAAGLLPVFIVGAVLVLDRAYWSLVRNRHFWFGILIGLLIVVPWHLYMYLTYGQPFWDQYLGYHVVQRANEAIEGHGGSFIDYLKTIGAGMFPWSFLVPLGLGYALLDIYNKHKGVLIVVLAFVITFVLYGFAVSSKLSQYILPVYPALALLVGRILGEGIVRGKSLAVPYIAVVSLIVLAGAGNKLQVVVACLGVVALLLVEVKRLQREQVLAVVSIGCLLVLGMYKVRILYTQPLVSEELQAAAITYRAEYDSLPFSERRPLAVGPGLTWETAAVFYSNRPTVSGKTPEEFSKVLHEEVANELILAKDQYVNYQSLANFVVIGETANFLVVRVAE